MSVTVQELYKNLAGLMESGKGDYEIYYDNYPEFLRPIAGEVEWDEEEKEVYLG